MARKNLLKRLLHSTSVRLSLRFALLYSLVTALVFAVAYKLADYETSSWIREQLVAEETALLQEYDARGLDGVIEVLSKYRAFNFENHRIYLLLGENGRRLVGNVNGIGWSGKTGYAEADAIDFIGQNENEAFGFILREFPLGDNTLVLGTSTYFQLELLEGLGSSLLAGFAFVTLIGAAAGIVVGRRTEHRLLQVSDTLQSVAKGDLEARVPLDDGSGDDLTRLSVEINRTISQLQKMVESQNQITADIAHDLRTPMQRLRQRLESIGQSAELSDQLVTEIYATIDDVDELIEIFHALLRISQIESGARRESFDDVDLVPILARIEDAYSAVAEENGQKINFTVGTAPLVVSGDKRLLTQMMANTVENALRHCPPAAHIDVALLAGPNETIFAVSDNGPGIPEHEREKVFRRFYRVEKSRTTPGNGLGFSLIKAVADLHGAKISLSDNHPGLTVTVMFPSPTLASSSFFED